MSSMILVKRKIEGRRTQAGRQRRSRLDVVVSCILFLFHVIPVSGSNSNASTSDDKNAVCNSKECDHPQQLELELAPTEEEKGRCGSVDGRELCESGGDYDQDPNYDPNVLVHQNSWGEPQEIPRYHNDYDKAHDLLLETEQYMTEEVYGDDERYEAVRDICKNNHKSCTVWAAIGRCDTNEAYMTKYCAPACQTCELLDYDTRCTVDDWETLQEKSIWQPNDLDDMFANIVNHPSYRQYQPVIYSKPGYVQIITQSENETKVIYNEDEGTEDDEEEQINQQGVPTIQDGPWVVTLENFLTDEECDALIALGAKEGYKRSEEVGKKGEDGTYGGMESSIRTSTNAWCYDSCHDHNTTKRIRNKMSDVTGIPDTNSEYLQLLRYEEKQFYRLHHDYISYQTDRSEGARILTLFLYLNDVDVGGGTEFPMLGLKIMPRKGKALLWPSVMNDDPDFMDFRTYHQALPVEEGIKYGANAWFHSRNFKEAHARGCT